MAKTTIIQEGMKKIAYIDGKDISSCTTGIDVHICANEMPSVFVDMVFSDSFIELTNSDVDIRIHPETLQEAASILLHEFSLRSDWYDALIMSIENYIKDVLDDKDAYSVAKGIANRLLGIEKRGQTIQ